MLCEKAIKLALDGQLVDLLVAVLRLALPLVALGFEAKDPTGYGRFVEKDGRRN